MKRKSCLTLALILIMAQVISLFAVLPATADTTKNYSLIQSTGDMTIDGKADEVAWAKADWSSQFVKVGGNYDGSSSFDVRFKAMWSPAQNDQMNVYILVVAKWQEIPGSRWGNGNSIRIQIGNEEGTEYFWTEENKVGANGISSSTLDGSVVGGLSTSYQVAAVDTIAADKTVIYEFGYQMDQTDCINFDILVRGGFYGSSWQALEYSWANMTKDTFGTATGANGIGTISDQTYAHTTDIIQTTEAVGIDGTIDAAWSNAEWSNQLVKVGGNYDGSSTFNVRFKTMWLPVEGNKMNVYILVVAKGQEIHGSKWGNGNSIRIQIGNEEGTEYFWTEENKVGANGISSSTLDGSVVGGLSTSYQVAAVDTITTDKTVIYEFGYQMDQADCINFDILVKGGFYGSSWQTLEYSWANMTGTTFGTATGATGCGMITDQTYLHGLNIIKTTENIQIDGVADDVWAYADWSSKFVKVGGTYDGSKGERNLDVRFKALWSPVEGDDSKMNVYILVSAAGDLYDFDNGNGIQIQMGNAAGTEYFWSGMRVLTTHIFANETHEFTNGGSNVSEDSHKSYKLAATTDMTSDNKGQFNPVTYEFCYQMDRADAIKLDVLARCSTSGSVSGDTWKYQDYSWANTTSDNMDQAAAGVGNIVDIPTDQLLADLQEFVVDAETQGASVYLNTATPDLSGIRFATTINVDAFNALMAQGATITTGTLVTYTETLTTLGIADKDFDLDTLLANGLVKDTHFYNIVNEGNGWVDGKPGTWFATIYDIKDYSRQFSAVGYITIKFGEFETTVYEEYDTDTDARSIAYVAEEVMTMESNNGHIGLDALGQDRGMFTTKQEAILEDFYNTGAQQ